MSSFIVLVLGDEKMKHKDRTKTLPHYLRAVPYDRQDNNQELAKAIEVSKTPFVSNGEPDLEFIANGTRSISEGTGILAQFCPHEEYCPKVHLDANCFYEKFLHCVEARQLEIIHQLSQVNKYYLKYRKQVLSGQLPIST